MAFAVLKNIGYPLLWNDEGETAMFAERVLDFGYPKVGDGKNFVYCLELEDKMAGRRTVDGAYLGSGWGHFYFGAIGALAARAADAIAGRPGIESPPDLGRESRGDRPRNADVYLKTALLRIPFALAGLAAIVLLVIAVAPLLGGGSTAPVRRGGSSRQDPPHLGPAETSFAPSAAHAAAKFANAAAREVEGQPAGGLTARVWLFAAAVFAWQALSVPWALHMREMRYYSLVCLLLAWILYLAVRRHIGRMGPRRYGMLMFAALALLLVTFPVAAAGAAGTLGIWEVVGFARRRNWRKAAEGIAPLTAAGLAMGAYMVVFRTFEIFRGFSKKFPWTIAKARHTADRMLALFFDFESLWVIAAALGLGVTVAIVSWARGRRRKRKGVGTEPALATEARTEIAEIAGKSAGPLMMGKADRRLVGLAAVIAVYAALHAAVVMRQPFPIAFSRYYIWLQPAAGLAMWLCLFAMGGTIRTLGGKWVRRAAGAGLAGGFVLLAALTAGERVPVLKERVFELFHKNFGSMDYAVAFVRRTYPDPSRLVIATNYEECVLQYYLGSKVTVGFVGNNLEEDLRVVPDIIIGRKRPTYTDKPLMELMKRAAYRIRTLPIVDTVTNAVPEVGSGEVVHLFRTPRPGSARQALEIRVKK